MSRNTVVYRLRHKDGFWRRVASVGTYLLDDPVVRGLTTKRPEVLR